MRGLVGASDGVEGGSKELLTGFISGAETTIEIEDDGLGHGASSGSQGALVSGLSYFDRWPPGLPFGWPGCAGVFFLGLPFGQPPFLAFRRAAAALARLVARPACAARTLPMSAPHLGHFSLLILRHYRRCPCVRHVHLGPGPNMAALPSQSVKIRLCKTPKWTFKALTIPIWLGIVGGMAGKFVAYYRVSTTKQGINGLGMDAQRDAVARYLNGGDWKLIAEFAEVESGKRNNRQEMEKAIALCRREGATLLIAKLDRLARNAAFLLNLRDSGVDFIAVDMPHADKFTVGIMALVAEKERDMISQRTRDGLAAAKRRGIKLGNPRPAQALKVAQTANLARADAYATSLLPVAQEIRAAHVTTLRKIARCLNARGFKTPNHKAFKAQSVKNLLERTAGAAAAQKPT